MKICIHCNKKLALRNFSGDKSRKDNKSTRCKVCIRKYAKEYRIKKGWVKKETRSYEDKREYLRIWMKNKRNSDPIFNFKCSTRSLLYNAFRRACESKYQKSISTEDMLCCSMEYFIEYIKSMFTEGMTIDNYGKWHLDHINPLSDCNNHDEILKYNHYSNLQPLWAKDNILKSNKKILQTAT